MLREEDIARQRAPFNNKFFAKLYQNSLSQQMQGFNSDLLFDIVALGCSIGPLLSKNAQTTQDIVDHHIYPSGKMVIKAFIADNFIFYDEKKHVAKDWNKDSLQQACFIKITSHIKKTPE
jgi:hypothetical protein